MIIEIPVSYRAVVTCARRRNPETIRVWEKVPVKIGSADDLPLAARLLTPRGDAYHYYAHRDGLVTALLREGRPVAADEHLEHAIAMAIGMGDDLPFPAAMRRSSMRRPSIGLASMPACGTRTTARRRSISSRQRRGPASSPAAC